MQRNRILIRDGYVMTMDDSLGEHERGSVLIEGDSIVEVGPNLEADAADVIDATGMVIMPGFVDTHRHTWQTQLRAICADMSLVEYVRTIRMTFSPRYRAEDVYFGNYAGALEALDAGVTTILDYSHCNNSPQHADAGISGLRDAGIRAVYAYGFFASPVEEPVFTDHKQRIEDARRVREQHFSSSDGLLTMGVAITETGFIPFDETLEEVRTARDIGALVAAHTGCFWGSQCCMGIPELHHHGLLREDQVHIHCNALSDHEFRLLADTGAKVSISPETETQMGMGRPVFRQCFEHGIEPTLSCDVISLNSGDMFAQMRLGLQFQRCMDNDPINWKGAMPSTIDLKVRDAIRWATQNGANACGLGSQVGSLTPGKKADVVLVAPNRLNLTPMPEPVGSIVVQANAANVDTVLVDGRVVKRDGELVGHDFARIQRMADETREHLFSEVLAAKGTILPPETEGSRMMDINALAASNVARAYAIPAS